MPREPEERSWQIRVGAEDAAHDTNGGLNGATPTHQQSQSHYYTERTSELDRRAQPQSGSQHKFMMHQISEHEHRLIDELRNTTVDSASQRPVTSSGFVRSATTGKFKLMLTFLAFSICSRNFRR